MELATITLLLFMHFVADFILQSNWMAQNKSKNNWALFTHVFIYSLPFILISPLYAAINGLLHLLVDYNTSHLSSKLWANGKVHWFFVVIGFDQLLHALCLLWTYNLLF